jgi:hypothetical protein
VRDFNVVIELALMHRAGGAIGAAVWLGPSGRMLDRVGIRPVHGGSTQAAF